MVNRSSIRPRLVPLGDEALLVRFGDGLSEQANRAAIAFAHALQGRCPAGVHEMVPNLISVLLRFDSAVIDFDVLAGEVRLLLGGGILPVLDGRSWEVAIIFGGAEGPDLADAATALGLSQAEFIGRHNAAPLRVLATGFAPGFVYCGFHADSFSLPRRTSVRSKVPAGSVLFAAGQTAIAATAIPTGWHVIGWTEFANFKPSDDPPTRLRPGDSITFVEAGR